MATTKEYLEQLIEKGKIPGCELIVKQNHQTRIHHVLGYADLEKKEKLTSGRLFYLYSGTKPITVTAAMKLVWEGKLELDAPVWKYLPQYRNITAYSNGALISVGDRLTVRNLFTMTGGFNYDIGCDEVKRLGERAVLSEIADALASKPLDFVPGEKYQYSLCHDVLGAVVEKVSGETFGQYLQKNFFSPLGMERTRFGKRYEEDPRMVPLYQADREGNITVQKYNEYIATQYYQSGGAGLVSTASDYAAFADMLACGGVAENGERIMHVEAIRNLHSEQLSRILPSRKADFGGEPEIGYGYGFGVRTLIDRKPGIRSHIGEFGWGGAAGAYILIDPETSLSIVYLQHVLNRTGKTDYCLPLRDMVFDELKID